MQKNTGVELKARVEDKDGNVITWWSDKFQEQLMNHPKVIELYEQEKQSNKEYLSSSQGY